MAAIRRKIVVITGPTASGKSALSVQLAHRFGGEIINADSMQVYRGMDVGTAKPTFGDREGVAHHLIDIVDPDEPFNAAIYRSLALPAIEGIVSRKKVCFVVGGTGLYIRTLLGGLIKLPFSDPGLREKLTRDYEECGSQALHERLKRLDPESAQKIHPNDRVRIIRALEIIQTANRPLSSLIQEHRFKDQSFEVCKICLQMDRQHLYDRINKRTLQMMKHGLVEETEGLLKKGYSSDLKPMQSIGYRHVINLLNGVWDLDETVSRLQADTRRYAKRQLTWFRAEPGMNWFGTDDKGRRKISQKIEEFHLI